MKHILWLLAFARPATKRLSLSVLARLVGHILGAAQFALPAWAIGMFATGAAAGAGFVVLIAAIFVVITAAKAGLRYIEQLYGHLAAFSLMGEMRVWLIDRLIPQAPAVTDGAGAARIQSTAVRDVDRVEVFFAHTIAPAITAVLIPIGAFVTARIMAGPLPALVLALVLLVGIIVPITGVKRGAESARQVAHLRSDTAQFVADSVRLREEIIAAEAVAARLERARQADRQLATALLTLGRRAGIRSGVNSLRIWVGTLLVLLTALASGANLPGGLAAAALVAGTAASLDTVERLAGSLPAGLEATRRIRELASGKPVVTEPESSREPDRLTAARVSVPALAVDNVSFTYPGRSEPVIDGLSLDVPSGAMIGIAGASGSGKSTLARLLQRHFDVQAGEIRVADVPLPALGSTAVAQRVIVADQTPFLLDASVAENLRLAAPDAEDSELQMLLDLVALDRGLTDALGRRGERLSGGQRQRLALARTLLRGRRAPGGLAGCVLVLDEATSHQDPLTQARLMTSLRTLGITMVVIAHRLETLREADRIHVMERGRIVESGNWHELSAGDGAFRKLLDAGA
ncbi:amino acid ABC transporter ATP-binding/permease protein [Gulosibacter chungangensis]|uniref:ABC transporter ATP-binding protein n=1 Tax=Gulosibacter chungangensis TaxID=979746 RepID=A0A7J5B8R6_9MICO|nr:ABC transporter ATP-binding protein [Gulosibacter chungangensis]KAB1641198.1 ABC transporter ATP-binding protein [Gulosibacter chungangensis]